MQVDARDGRLVDAEYVNDFHKFHSSHSDGYDPSRPFIEPAFYSMGVQVVYRSGAAKYESESTVAPEEPG